MEALLTIATQLQQELIARLDGENASGQAIWLHFREMALSPIVSSSPKPPADTLLITFGYQSLAREQMTLKLVRQLLLGTDNEILAGAQVQCLLHFQASRELAKLAKQLKELTRLGSWAFASSEAYLTFAEATPALQRLLADYRPVAIEIKSENLLA